MTFFEDNSFKRHIYFTDTPTQKSLQKYSGDHFNWFKNKLLQYQLNSS